jgi:hypothetical protein
MNIKKEKVGDRVLSILLWSSEKQKKEYIEGECFLRQLIKFFRRNRRNVLLSWRELFFFKKNPHLIPEHWWGRRIYSLNPKSLKKHRDNFVYCFCLVLLNKDEVYVSWQALTGLPFTEKDSVAYFKEG